MTRKSVYKFFHLLTLVMSSHAAAINACAEDVHVFSDVSASDVAADSRESLPEIWTFDDCVNRAIERSSEVRQAMLAILQADENIGESKDAWLPTVAFSTNQSFTNYPSPSGNTRANTYGSSYNVNAAWTIWEGNVRKYRLEASRLLKKQQLLAGDNVVMTLKLGILEAYLNIMYADEAVSIARQTLEVSTSQTDRARRLMESGRTSKVDFAQIESQTAQDRYNLVQAEANLESARLTLKKILALGLDTEMRIADVSFSDADVSPSLPDKSSTFAIASGWVPGIKANDLNKEIYDYDIKIAKAGNLPNISLQGGLGTGYYSGGTSWASQMGHAFNENIGVQLSIPVYDGNATRRAVAKARLASLEYDIERDRLLDELSHTIENLYIEAENAKAKYSAGTVQLEAASLTATLVDRQFELGLVNPLELLTAHNNLLNSRLELLQNKFMAILANKTINYYATQQISLK